MKKLIMILLLAISLTSCKKESYPEPKENNKVGNLAGSTSNPNPTPIPNNSRP